MPLDTNLALQTQGPADPLERYGKVLALKNAIQQGQSGQLQLQQQQMDMEDQQKLRQAFQSSGGDLDKLQQNAVQLGVGPKTLMQLKDTILKQRETLANIDDKELTVKKDHTEAIGAAAQSLLQLPTPEARAAAYPQVIGALVQQGRIKPTDVPGQYPGDEAIQQYANVARSSQQIIDSVMKEREVKAQEQNATSQAATAATAGKRETREGDQQAFQNAISDLAGNPPANSAEYNARVGQLSPAVASRILQAVPVGQYDPAKSAATLRNIGMTPEQQTQAGQAAANATQTAAYQTGELAQGAQRVTIAQGELAARNKELQEKYGDVLNQISPTQKSLAEKLASGDLNPSQLSRFPDKEKLVAAAIAINPSWSQATFDTKQAFENPKNKQAVNLGTINRVVGHIGRFEENSQKIGFAPAYASGMNLTGAQNKLNDDAHAIAAEFEKLVSGGIATEGQTKQWMSNLRSPSADARQKSIDEISQLIGSQYESMNQTYKTALGTDIPAQKFFSPATRDWMAKKGINVTGAAPGSAAAQPANAGGWKVISVK